MQDLHVDGLLTAFDEEECVEYYFTESMALGNCIIKFDHLHTEDDKIEHMISVSLLDDTENAFVFIVYWDKPLVPLLIRSIVQQIVEHFDESCEEHFIEFMKDMSTQYICSDDQDTEEHADSIFDDVIYDLGVIANAKMAFARIEEIEDETPDS